MSQGNQKDYADNADPMVGARHLEWSIRPGAKSYDFEHLRTIHEQLYGNHYTQAGKMRDFVSERNGVPHVVPEKIGTESQRLFSELQNEKRNLDRADATKFSERAGYYMGELERLRPFKDGNERTQQVFISQLARDSGHNVEWKKMDAPNLERARAEAMHGNHMPFQELLRSSVKQRAIELRMQDGRHDKDVLAMKVIERNRESLYRMERSYPGEHSKQREIATAKVMLNSMEFAVRNKSPELTLSYDPSAPKKSNDGFERTMQSPETRGALAMVKQSVHAVERAGSTVHHELSQQWNSKMQTQLDHGHDRSIR